MTAARNIVPALRSAASILIATPNPILRRRLGDSLRQVTSVEDASTGAEALSMLERRGARIVVLDRKLPDLNCDELIGVVERQFPCTDVVLLDSELGEISCRRSCATTPPMAGFRSSTSAWRARLFCHPRRPRRAHPLPAASCRCLEWSAPAKPCSSSQRWSVPLPRIHLGAHHRRNRRRQGTGRRSRA